jgi:hypothetical protein
MTPSARTRSVLYGALAIVGCGGSTEPATNTTARPVCTIGTAVCASRIEVTPGRFVQSYQNFRLADGDSLVTQAVIVVHGVERNADDYFTSMVEAATLAERISSSIIIAPRFITTDDGPAADEPVWTSSGWRDGDLSSSIGPLPRISSYAVIDTIMVRLANRARFPRLTRIVITGHSAGGQLLHRFAATSRAAQSIPSVTVRYVVANPSSWLYLGPERVSGQSIAVPTVAACPDYDDWHYGLQGRNTYANALSAAAVQQQLTSRDVVMLLGTADTLTADLDVSCAGNLQGPRRFQRGQTLLNYMNARFAGHAHRLVTIPGIGHSNRGMFTAAEGRRALFP